MAIPPKIPEHSDFQISFPAITKDGNAVDVPSMLRWTFTMGKNIDGVPLILKDNLSTPAAFTTGIQSVTVSIASTEYSSAMHGASGGDGIYTIALYALDPSGQFTHEEKKLNIFKQLIPSGTLG